MIRRLMVCAFAAACGGAEGGGTWGGRVDTLPNGTIVVHNPETGIWDSASAWRIEEDLRIGTPEGEGPSSLNDVAAIEVDPAGRIWILDRETQDIRVFDPQGRHVRTVGRKGRGPGEYQQAVGMAWHPDGRLWVMDQQNVRYTVLDTAGHVVVGHTRPVSGFFAGQWLGGLDTAGRVYEYLWGIAHMDGTLLRFGPTLKNPDTIPVPRDEGQYFEIVRTGMRSRVSVPFAPSSRWKFDPRGYLWFGMTAPYRVYQRRVEGDTVRIIERPYTPLAVSGEDKDSAVARLKWFVDQGGSVDRGRIPDAKPALDKYFVDDRGNLWVDPVTPRADDGLVFDVFDPEGRYLGAVRSSFRIVSDPVFRADVLYAVTQDEVGIPYVVRARIVRP